MNAAKYLLIAPGICWYVAWRVGWKVVLKLSTYLQKMAWKLVKILKEAQNMTVVNLPASQSKL